MWRWPRSQLKTRRKTNLGTTTSSRQPLAHGEVRLYGIAIGAHVTDDYTVDIDLTTLIPQLDTVASDIVAHQRDTLTQRKDLAQKTKDFRKLDDASKLSDIKALLKGMQ